MILRKNKSQKSNILTTVHMVCTKIFKEKYYVD